LKGRRVSFSAMRIGIDIAQQQLEWSEVLGRARFADEAGFAGLWLFDHFKPLYADADGPCFEAWTALAALAASTERIRLGVLITGVTYRHPAVLTSQAITLDHISGGRLDFSLGAAWYEPEHTAFGIPFPPTSERIDRLDEALGVYKALMTTDRASLDAEHYPLQDATMHPRPVQEPYPPIWIGASGEKRMMPLVARHADVWHSFGEVDFLAQRSALLDRLAEEAGRDPLSIRRSTNVSVDGSDNQVLTQIDALAQVGITDVIVSWPSAGIPRVRDLATALGDRLG